jgi:ribosome-binding protein aMBF1 (putative translation factor)
MTKPKRKVNVGPRDATEELVFAEEGARIHVQWLFHSEMKRQGLLPSDLAARMGIPVARIEKFFDDDSNPPTKMLASMADALGCKLEITVTPKPPRKE